MAYALAALLPHRVRGFHDKFQLSALFFERNSVADDRRRKATLRAQAQSFHRDVAAGLGNALAQKIQRFKLRPLGGDQSENDKFIRRHIAE